MKKLLKKIGVLGGIAIGMLVALIWLAAIPHMNPIIETITNSVSYQGLGIWETLPLLGRAQTQGEHTKLVLGDSVANQLYQKCGDEEYCILTGNMAMTMMWQYIYVREAMESHPETTDIYLCTTPDALDRSFEVGTSYCYVLIPLAESDNMNVLEETQKELLQKMYGAFFVKPQVAKFIGKTGLNIKLFLNGIKKFYEIFPQRKAEVEKKNNPDLELAETYLKKMYELCKEKNVTLHLIPNPKRDTPEDREHMKRLEQQYKQSLLYEINPDFFEQIVYYPEEYFKDELHFKDELIKAGGQGEIIKAIQESTGTMENLRSR